MASGLGPGRVHPVLQTLQREAFRLSEIADAMLVMNRERFARFARDGRRTAAQAEHLLPILGGGGVPPPAARQTRERAQGITRDRPAAGGGGPDRAFVRLVRPRLEAGAGVDASERQRFARIASIACSSCASAELPPKLVESMNAG